MRAFVSVIFFYALTLGIGIAVADQRISEANIPIIIPDFAIRDVFTIVILSVAMTLLFLHFRSGARASFGVLLTLAALAGSIFVFSAWLAWPWDLVTALVVVLLMRVRPSVLSHDLGIAVTIAGIATLLGLALTPLFAVGLLAVLSIYDVFAVYRTRHMVAMAEGMLETGSVFGFLIPVRARAYRRSVVRALTDRTVMVLGSGDIGLPLVLATSSVATSLNTAFVVSGASILGLALMQWLFLHQARPAPMAALPPIAVCTIFGYLLAVFLGI